MRNDWRQQKRSLYICLVLGTLFAVTVVSAQGMQSSNYQIEFDSVNTAGIRSASPSYTIEDTVGEIATGDSSSANFRIRAGYQQMNETYLALTSPPDVTLTPSIGGITGGTANGSTTVTATTDNTAGYQLTIVASSSPAMQHTNISGETIPNYTPAGVNPDYNFFVATSSAEFAFSIEGTDTTQRFLDNGSSCNTGSGNTTDTCWDAIGTTDTVVADRTSANHPNGSDTTIKLRAEVGSESVTIGGVYRATSTLTLIAL